MMVSQPAPSTVARSPVRNQPSAWRLRSAPGRRSRRTARDRAGELARLPGGQPAPGLGVGDPQLDLAHRPPVGLPGPLRRVVPGRGGDVGRLGGPVGALDRGGERLGGRRTKSGLTVIDPHESRRMDATASVEKVAASAMDEKKVGGPAMNVTRSRCTISMARSGSQRSIRVTRMPAAAGISMPLKSPEMWERGAGVSTVSWAPSPWAAIRVIALYESARWVWSTTLGSPGRARGEQADRQVRTPGRARSAPARRRAGPPSRPPRRRRGGRSDRSDSGSPGRENGDLRGHRGQHARHVRGAHEVVDGHGDGPQAPAGTRRGWPPPCSWGVARPRCRRVGPRRLAGPRQRRRSSG